MLQAHSRQLLRLAPAIGALALAAFGCAPQDRRETTADRPQPPADSARPAEAKPHEAASAPADPAEEKEKTEKERRDLTRKLAKARREMDAGRQRMAKTKLANEFAELNHRLALDKARKELSSSLPEYSSQIASKLVGKKVHVSPPGHESGKRPSAETTV